MLLPALACALFAFVQFVLALRVLGKVPALIHVNGPKPARWPRLSIVVPARDEAAGIEAALRSKLATSYPDVEVVVVDDRSTDGTGAIAQRFADVDRRVVVARVDELPSGWLGKVHAMSVGVARASGDFVLLSDADVHIAPGVFERVIAFAENERVDFVSMLPRLDKNGLFIDACTATMTRVLALAGQTWAANDDRSAIGVGVGAFNLVRRSALDASPGLQHLRMEMADDVALGAMMKASGARCRFFAARDDVTVLYAESVGELARGLEKGGGMFGFSALRALLLVSAWLAIDLGVPLAAIGSGGHALVAIGVTQLALATIFVLARHFHAPLRGVWLWPIGAVLGGLFGIRSGYLAWRRQAIVWRGTAYGKADIEGGRRWIRGRVDLGPKSLASGL